MTNDQYQTTIKDISVIRTLCDDAQRCIRKGNIVTTRNYLRAAREYINEITGPELQQRPNPLYQSLERGNVN